MTKDERISMLEEELYRYRNGHQGSCYACEPVAVENKRLLKEYTRMMEQEAELKTELERLRHKLWEFNWYQHTGKPPARYS